MKNYLVVLRRLIETAFFQCCMILLLFSCMFAFAMYQGGFVSWFILYAFLPVVIYMLFLMFYPLKAIRVERRIDAKRLVAGSSVHVRIDLKRKWAAPLLLVTVQDDAPLAADSRAGQGKTVIIFWIRRDASVTYSIPKLKRGHHVLSSIRLTVGDPFGFFQKSILLNCKTVMLVFPEVYPLPNLAPGLGGGSSRYRSADIDVTQFSGVRAYQPSDRLSWLDWKSTARSNQLVTKQFEMERDLHASVVFVAQLHDSDRQFERGISFTASLVRALLSDGYTVLFTYSRTGKPLFLQPRASHELGELDQVLALLTREEALKTDDVQLLDNKRNIGFAVSTDIALASRMSRFAASVRHPQTLFYVTDAESKTKVRPISKTVPFFSLYQVTGEPFDKLKKVGR
ncbi:DUF58 domain-containing protein [Sporolactobacillus sp. THM7-7]|nr:DUF58 domain-containing protein [Sporolactobacillus sp. THM7-7]